MKNKKGFIFVETIIVTAVLLASLMLVYALFVSSNNTETRRLRYDDTAKLYETFYLKKYLESFELGTLKARITPDKPVQMIYSGQSELFGSAFTSEKNFFENLWINLHIQSMILVPYNVSELAECDMTGKSSNYRNNVIGLCSNNNLVSYMRSLDDDGSSDYRLIVEYATNLAGNSCTSNNDCFYYYANVRVGA